MLDSSHGLNNQNKMVINKAIKTIQEFIQFESASGIILVGLAVLAIVLDNTGLSPLYTNMREVKMTFEFGGFSLSKPLILWVNDGLMAIFFFLVGLEIKREVVEGELNSISKFALPGFAAVGGMVVPGLIYTALNWHDATYLHGWAIPTATDIAFALGILSLLGSRVPVSLKIFLTALAILDDLGAIIIIAVFYTHKMSYLSLSLAAICMMILLFLNLARVRRISVYLFIGVILWVCVLKSGVHATLAGVVLAMAIPLREKQNPKKSPVRELEHALHPWVAFIVLPIFAFFNAGVSFNGVSYQTFTHPIPLGIALGLFFGKQVGVFGAAWLAVKFKLAKLPHEATWLWIYGVAILCGIGFTMSLFIGTLAFNQASQNYAAMVRLGVIIGSVSSGILGYFVLLRNSRTLN